MGRLLRTSPSPARIRSRRIAQAPKSLKRRLPRNTIYSSPLMAVCTRSSRQIPVLWRQGLICGRRPSGLPNNRRSSSLAERRAEATLSPGPSLCPYSPTCLEGEFRELRLYRSLRSSSVESSRRLTPPSQGRQDVLGTAVLAFRQPLAQLTDDQARHTVALEPSEQLLLAGRELHPLQVSTHLGRQALPQEIHSPSPPLGRSLASWYRASVT